MSKLNKAQRDALSESDFGDPKARLYPIVDQDDVDSAARLIGKAGNPAAVKARIIAIAKRKQLSIPDAWKSANMSATFALGDGTDAGEMVIRTGKVFEAGDFADKGLEISPEELQAAIADFQPLAIGTGHPTAASPLDGKLGEWRGAQLDANGWDVLGTVALPKWLDDMLGEDERKVSAVIDRSTKRFIGLDLVTSPRIDGAALYAAFAKRHDTNSGQSALQTVHDVAAQYGAVCKPPAQMSAKHEVSGLQQVHDTAVEHGAQCSSKGDGRYPMFSKEKKRMGFKDAVKAWFAAGTPEEFDPAAFSDPPATSGQLLTSAPDPEVAALKAEVARERGIRISSEAASFADSEIAAFRALPAEREDLISDYMDAATNDAGSGPVTFSDGTQGSRVERLKARSARRPAHELTRELLDPGKHAVFGNGGTKPAMTPERRAELLGMTAIGQATLNGTSSN